MRQDTFSALSNPVHHVVQEYEIEVFLWKLQAVVDVRLRVRDAAVNSPSDLNALRYEVDAVDLGRITTQIRKDVGVEAVVASDVENPPPRSDPLAARSVE